MATTLPSPPATPPPSTAREVSSSSDLAEKLDGLLESYLSLLDTYTSLRTQLSKEFSSGFLSLAHANRNAAAVLGAGRRFGQEGYDERMKTIRGVSIERVDHGKGETGVKTTGAQRQKAERQRGEMSRLGKSTSTSKDSLDHNGKVDATESNSSPEHDDQPENHCSPEAATTEDSRISAPGSTQADASLSLDSEAEHLAISVDKIAYSASNREPGDPLLWFTALPPQALRQTQSHFTSTITTTIPELLTTISKMEALEKRIWDVRGEIGIIEDYESVQTGRVNDSGEVSEEGRRSGRTKNEGEDGGSTNASAGKPTSEQDISQKDMTHLNTSRKQSLVSRARPSEPRSRLLKLD